MFSQKKEPTEAKGRGPTLAPAGRTWGAGPETEACQCRAREESREAKVRRVREREGRRGRERWGRTVTEPELGVHSLGGGWQALLPPACRGAWAGAATPALCAPRGQGKTACAGLRPGAGCTGGRGSEEGNGAQTELQRVGGEKSPQTLHNPRHHLGRRVGTNKSSRVPAAQGQPLCAAPGQPALGQVDSQGVVPHWGAEGPGKGGRARESGAPPSVPPPCGQGCFH